MPLERGRIIRYDVDRMAFEFTMIDMAQGKAKIVNCKISSTAMDQLAGIKGTMPSEREAQFVSLRDGVERIASDLFDKAVPKPVRIHIFHHHIPLTHRRKQLRNHWGKRKLKRDE
jgi:Protein of unknown function (DUF1488)